MVICHVGHEQIDEPRAYRRLWLHEQRLQEPHVLLAEAREYATAVGKLLVFRARLDSYTISRTLDCYSTASIMEIATARKDIM